jgi:hypothetical protein
MKFSFFSPLVIKTYLISGPDLDSEVKKGNVVPVVK